ncbi:unnamed protein product [Paramecium octaurelia]|uniref:Uncharacterized protein n=1 Tax=Paramecium octaurelia TaxID=43137 RepID=A0A8S1V827_PAROT|nr:unnamed protein product [Paramecium octaurelia]
MSQTTISQVSNIIATTTCIGVASASSLVAGVVVGVVGLSRGDPPLSKWNLMRGCVTGCVAGGISGSTAGYTFGILEGCVYKLIGYQEKNIIEITKSRSRTGAYCCIFGLIGEPIGVGLGLFLIEMISGFGRKFSNERQAKEKEKEKLEEEENEKVEILEIENNKEEDDEVEILYIGSNNENEDNNQITQQD